MTRRRPLALLLCLPLLGGAVAGPAGAEDAPGAAEPAPETEAAPLDGQIKTAIERGVAYLRTRQRPDGSWGPLKDKGHLYTGGTGAAHTHPLGATAMALYAMLKCDVPATDPAITKGFAWLDQRRPDHNTSAYELSACLLAATAVADPFKKNKDADAASVKLRLTGAARTRAASLQTALMARRAPGGGGWRYSAKTTEPGGPQDVSSTMLAVLALASADRCGLPVPTEVYAKAAAYVMTLQEPDGPETDRAVFARGAVAKPGAPDRYAKPTPPGRPKKDRARGFHYSIHPTTLDHDKSVTGARTACGIGTLILARHEIGSAPSRPKDSPPPEKLEQAIYDGLAWLASNFSAWGNPGAHGSRAIYYLYCVERAMDMVGAERLGESLWYVDMVQSLLGEQKEKGEWDTKDEQIGLERSPVIDTCYALLFLRRSTKGAVPSPVVTGGEGD